VSSHRIGGASPTLRIHHTRSASLTVTAPIASPADVPFMALFSALCSGIKVVANNALSGNRRAQPSKALVPARGRPSLARSGRSLSSRSRPLTALIGRRWVGSAERRCQSRRLALRVPTEPPTASAGTRGGPRPTLPSILVRVVRCSAVGHQIAFRYRGSPGQECSAPRVSAAFAPLRFDCAYRSR